jgi:hypothetical protein
MLLYALLHRVKAVNAKSECLGEPSVTFDDIKRFQRSAASVRATPSTI